MQHIPFFEYISKKSTFYQPEFADLCDFLDTYIKHIQTAKKYSTFEKGKGKINHSVFQQPEYIDISYEFDVEILNSLSTAFDTFKEKYWSYLESQSI